MSKATHNGTCQACGRIQALPSGRLAKHGYAVQWSMFVGICPGSGELPFQQSIGLIERYIASARAQAVTLRSKAAELRLTGLIDGKAWIHEYRSGSGMYRNRIPSSYHWTLLPIVEWYSYKTDDDDMRYVWGYTTSAGKKSQLCCGQSHDTAHDTAMHLNGLYADHFVKLALAQDQYVKWQMERIANWQPSALIVRESNR